MGLLSGSASITRFNVLGQPEEPAFEDAPFVAIQPGSEVRERIGFVPFEPDAPFRVGEHRWAFRVRIDRLSPDPTAAQERVKELVVAERERTGSPFVGARMRKKLRQLAEEELLATSTPRSRVIEAVLDGKTLYVGSTANAYLGLVLALLREVGVVCDHRTPWLERNDPRVHSDIVDQREPWQSVLGCRFARALLEDPDLMVEPEAGSARLLTRDASVGLTGAVLNDLLRYVEQGAEIVSLKLVSGDAAFRLDALDFRLSGVRIESEIHEGWIDQLDARLEKYGLLWDQLERKYNAIADDLVATFTAEQA